MPRGKLNEIHVQRTAVEWLAKYYQNKLDSKVVISGIEARVSKNSPLGSGRADGLIAAQLHDGSIYTVSVEAKSSRTWKAINVQHLHEKMIFHALVIAVLITGILLVLGILTAQNFLSNVVLPIIGITAVGFCVINFSQISIHYREIEVARQADRYPANEKWIAISTDIYNRLVSENQIAHFERICQNRGIGLIRVTSIQRSVVVIHPKSIPTPKTLDNFLTCYARAKMVQDKMRLALSESNSLPNPLLLDKPEESNSESLESMSDVNVGDELPASEE